jgi:hypothetical protein
MPKEKIEYALTLEQSKFNRGLKLAAGRVDTMGREMRRAMRPVRAEFSSLGKGLALGVAAGVAASIIALGKLKKFVSESIALANTQEEAEVRLAAVLNATGHAAGFSLEQLKKYASQLQDVTAIGDEVTLSNMAILATFKQIKGDTFKDATAAAIDMSVALKMDLKSAFVMVGKALNDPVKGLTSLSRAGVTFTDSQKEMIKALVEVGDVAGAQKIILSELNSQQGGIAAAMRGTYKTSVDAAKGAWSDLKEEIGFAITKNKFFIDVANVAEQTFKRWGTTIANNREEMMKLAKNGFIYLVESMGMAIETLRFFYNGWQGLALAAHGAVWVIIKGMELVVKSIRFVLSPLDLLLTGLEAIGAIKVNPLANMEKELNAFASFSADEFIKQLDDISNKNDMFDTAKKAVDEFKKKISEIPNEYTDAAKNAEYASGQTAKKINKDTETIGKEAKQIGGVWTNVYDEAGQADDKFTRKAISNAERLGAKYEQILKTKAGVYTTKKTKNQGFAKGGDPFSGGLSGYGGGDRRLIMVEDGEHVIRKEAVSRMGHGFFQKFNNFQFPKIQGFATGGPIGSGQPSQAPIRHEHILRAPNGNSARVFSDDLNADRLINILQNGLVSSS